jgi:hypothetical protein
MRSEFSFQQIFRQRSSQYDSSTSEGDHLISPHSGALANILFVPNDAIIGWLCATLARNMNPHNEHLALEPSLSDPATAFEY